jgi:hypothetical protein
VILLHPKQTHLDHESVLRNATEKYYRLSSCGYGYVPGRFEDNIKMDLGTCENRRYMESAVDHVVDYGDSSTEHNQFHGAGSFLRS